MFTLCSTEQSILDAVKVLADADYVILDCEGRDLGCLTGALSLISLGTPNATNIYLFDVLALPRDALLPLYNDIISSPAKLKVVWDGRMDDSELFHTHSCPIENVLDLQLADVASREARGHGDGERLRRFGRKAFPQSEVNKLQLEDVHALNSMDYALQEHCIFNAPSKDEKVKKLFWDKVADVWMQRPLPDALLRYASGDITRIAKIYEKFLGRNYLEPRGHLLKLSSQYVSMYRAPGKPDQENKFLQCGFLPLTISLTVPTAGHYAESGASGPSMACSRCERTILERHFPVATNKNKHLLATFSDANNKMRLRTCKVCTFILAKAEYMEEGELLRRRLVTAISISHTRL